MYRPTPKKKRRSKKPNTSDNNFSYGLKKKRKEFFFFFFAWLTDNLSYTNGWKNCIFCHVFFLCLFVWLQHRTTGCKSVCERAHFSHSNTITSHRWVMHSEQVSQLYSTNLREVRVNCTQKPKILTSAHSSRCWRRSKVHWCPGLETEQLFWRSAAKTCLGAGT